MLLFLASLSIAGAWEVSTDAQGDSLYWPSMPIAYTINPDGGHGIEPAGIETMMAGSNRQWESIEIEGNEIELDYQGTTDLAQAAYEDDTNAVFFSDQWEADEDLVALTYIWSTSGGKILGFDMAFNAYDHDFGTDGAEDLDDLMNTMTHELGHALGLGHSTVEEATMFSDTFPGEIQKRDVHEDDIEAIQWLYAIEDTGDAPTERGFLGLCSHLPVRSAGWPLLLISAAVIGARSRRGAAQVLAMLVFVSALSSRAHATTLSLGLEDLIMRSDSIVYGKVMDTRVEVSGTLLETVATIEVEDTLFGPIRAQAEVRVPGGCLGELCLTVGGAPQPIHGSRVLVFLDDGRPVGLSAGYLLLAHDVAWVPLHGDGDCPHARTKWSLSEIRRLSR